ncbi:hypothetical protein LTR97_000338 [Elasticomyces elasticus]|uniref:Major facilitator superfamily (MFS) profile domain-containing protein n=1 Tax=Elasticomyces elasticus TaxID=574655 RepID=A0AAN7WJG6_9PEZI|nr:hypothetical protein LTR97_000338 [Elasticomyces elasticus]
MADILRESAVGQLLRLVNRQWLPYPDERPEFQRPDYDDPVDQEKPADHISPTGLDHQPKPRTEEEEQDVEAFQLAKTATAERTISRTLAPVRTSDGIILVDWYGSEDPHNWSSAKKLFVSFEICMYSFAVYFGSSVYTSSIDGIMERSGVGVVAASLGFALYVLACGIPSIGRNSIYVATFSIYVLLCIPEALVENFAGLMVLRFLLGFFGSPCLATGAATFQDMYAMIKMPYLVAFWAGAVTLGPALAPVVAGFSVVAKSWHWFAWEMLWLSGPIWLLMLFLLPETSASNILLRRARRLRHLTGNAQLKSQSEIDQSHMSPSEVAFDALIKPWQINALDPAVLFSTIYTALVYGIFNSFFESFPLVYPVIYGFNLGESNSIFLSVLVALGIAMPAYCFYYYHWVEPKVAKHGFGPPEERLIPALFASFLVPIGLFIFAWTTRSSVHWIVSVIGLVLDIPQYAASLFAANDFARSSVACGCILFAHPMFVGIRVPGGVSLLGGLTILCIGGVYFLYFFGANLRARSKFAAN